MGQLELSVRIDWIKTLVFSLIPLLVLIAVLEAGARVIERYHPTPGVEAGLGFSETSRLFIQESPHRMATNPVKRGNFRETSFALPKPPGVYRIMVLGESSVYFLDEELKQLARDFTSRLKSGTVEIINAGGQWYGSMRLRVLASELAGYDPDLAVVYTGNNEFEELEQFQLIHPRLTGLEDVLGQLAFFRVLRDLIARSWIMRAEREHDLALLAQGPSSSFVGGEQHLLHRFSLVEIKSRLETFRDNLGAIVKSFRDRKVAVLLGVPASNLVRPRILFDTDALIYGQFRDAYRAGRYREAAPLGRRLLGDLTHHQATLREAEIIEWTALQFGVPLFDMEPVIEAAEPHGIPGETLFVDHCHLNGPGMRLWRKTVATAIVRNFPRPSH